MIEYDVPVLILEYIASVTTMRTPTTVATYSKVRGSYYFNSSVTYDVQTNMVRRMLWSHITDMDSDQCPNASIAENSDTKNSTTFEKKKSVHHTNETIDRDIKPSKRPESRRECQSSRALPVRNGLIRYTEYLLCCSHSVYSLDEHLLHSSV